MLDPGSGGFLSLDVGNLKRKYGTPNTNLRLFLGAREAIYTVTLVSRVYGRAIFSNMGHVSTSALIIAPLASTASTASTDTLNLQLQAYLHGLTSRLVCN